MEFEQVNEIARAAYAGWLREGATLEDMRAGFDAMCAKPASDALISEAVVGGVWGKWVTVTPDADTVILHLHAGGFMIGSPDSHLDLATRIARAANARVFLPHYRLAPENPFPAALEDALAVYHAIVSADGGYAARVVISGDSAGGGLALATLVGIRNAGGPLPAAGVLLSPWADMTLAGHTMLAHEALDVLVGRETLNGMAEAYLGDHERGDPRASPIFADLTELPPLLLQVGSTEVLIDDSVRIANAVWDSGGAAVLEVGYHMFHVYQMFADQIPDAQAAIDRFGDFVASYIPRPSVVN